MNRSGNLEGLAVLLVDDDVEVREFLALCLENEGALVKQCLSAEEAVESLRERVFDAVATDMNLPGMDGINLLKIIRRNYGELPVILITGYSSVGSAVDALKLGAQDYLTKPLSSGDALTGAILKAVDHYKLSKQHRELQDRLLRAEKMESVGTLAGGVAHELNNILSPMVTLPEIIQMKIREIAQEGSDLSSLDEYLELIRSSGKTAAALVSDLLASTTQASYKKTSENLAEIVREVSRSQEVVDVLINAGGIRIQTDLADNVPDVVCSRHHVARVTTNLIRNAAEAIREKGSASGREPVIRIAVKPVDLDKPLLGYDVVLEGRYVLMEVSDNGPGIEDKHLKRIFDPFYSSKKRTRHSGSGLGLSVVHGVVKDHGGAIDVRSNIGDGTTFSLYFPLVESIQKPAAEDIIAVRGGTERLMVIDDSPVQRILAEKVLSNLGYRVTSVSSGREAVSVFRESYQVSEEQPFDLVLLDMIMEEDFDGLTAYEKISDMYPGIRTIVLTAFATSERVETLLELGACLLMKPYESKELAAAVRAKLDESPEERR